MIESSTYVSHCRLIAICNECRYAMKHVKEGSCIINTTSVQAYLRSPSSLEYQSTKGAIVAFTRGLTLELIHRGIRVNGVAPRPVWTLVQVVVQPEDKVTTLGSETPMDRDAQPHEIAPSYVFLASQDSLYYTAQVLHNNGAFYFVISFSNTLKYTSNP
ncbi:Glucose and ribitol dehydrogenase2 [Abeliophyllum distichum]|uniref:Glucose and ribitol dehydrogenase2 n=1 Tax=Abeliophyllum distichum TaxID=126358 RepID=A0ABD1T211_9LAMI